MITVHGIHPDDDWDYLRRRRQLWGESVVKVVWVQLVMWQRNERKKQTNPSQSEKWRKTLPKKTSQEKEMQNTELWYDVIFNWT